MASGATSDDTGQLVLMASYLTELGDGGAYAHFRDRYRDMAKTLGFEGHIAWPRRCHDGSCVGPGHRIHVF